MTNLTSSSRQLSTINCHLPFNQSQLAIPPATHHVQVLGWDSWAKCESESQEQFTYSADHQNQRGF